MGLYGVLSCGLSLLSKRNGIHFLEVLAPIPKLASSPSFVKYWKLKFTMRTLEVAALQGEMELSQTLMNALGLPLSTGKGRDSSVSQLSLGSLNAEGPAYLDSTNNRIVI